MYKKKDPISQMLNEPLLAFKKDILVDLLYCMSEIFQPINRVGVTPNLSILEAVCRSV